MNVSVCMGARRDTIRSDHKSGNLRSIGERDRRSGPASRARTVSAAVLNLAREGVDSGDDISAEFERLLDIQAAFFRLPSAAGGSSPQ